MGLGQAVVMRGAFRAFCIAAGSLALLATHASAAEKRSALVPFRLVDSGLSRTADSYLSGDQFAFKFDGPSGPVSLSGVVDPFYGIADLNGPPAPDRFGLRNASAHLQLSSEFTLDLGYRLDHLGQF